METTTNLSNDSRPVPADDALFGWDTTPGIVSVWASRVGKAWVWQRTGDRVVCTHETFRPWLFATTLDDLAHLGSALQPEEDEAAVSYRVSDGPDGSYRYLLSARDGRVLERALLSGASQRLNRRITSLSALGDTYYRVGPVEQYLMSTGRVIFRGMAYHDLHRLQFDLETTSLDPARGRIFLVAVRDNRGFEQVLEAAAPETEATLIATLCALIRSRDPAAGWLSGCAALDAGGFVLTDRSLDEAHLDVRWKTLGRRPLPFETSYPGLFAVGDVRAGSIKRVAAAVSEGSAAVRSVHEYLAFAH